MKNYQKIFIALVLSVIVMFIFAIVFLRGDSPSIPRNTITLNTTMESTEYPTLTKKPYGILWTPVSTLPITSADPTITALYKSNNCRLPCWQGIVPGETSWNEAWKMMGKLAKNTDPGEMWLIDVDETHYYFEVHLLNPPLDSQYGIVYYFIRKQDFIIDNIWLNVGNEKSYDIINIFTNYGQPESIYYFSYSRPGGYNIWLYLYYPNIGFITSYFSTFETDDWSTRTENICFQKKISLSVWPGNYTTTFPSVLLHAPEVDEIFIDHIVPLIDIAGVSIDEFYKENLGNKGEVCLDVSLKDT